MAVKRWTESELIAAIKLYCRTTFGRMHARNPDIIALAAELGRTPSSIALKLVNFAALDTSIPQRGMSNYSALDRQVWNRFFAHLGQFVADDATSDPTPMTAGFAERATEFIWDEGSSDSRIGRDVDRTATARVGQSFFRTAVLTAYESRCALTGVTAPELLVASHILPWAENIDTRLNPTNGICLNALFDRAFDRGLIAFGDDLRVRYSPKLPGDTRQHLERSISSGGKLHLPSRFQPNLDFIRAHRVRSGLD